MDDQCNLASADAQPRAELSGETVAQREEVCAAWGDLPAQLTAHPAMKRLYRALGGIRRPDDPGVATPYAPSDLKGLLEDLQKRIDQCEGVLIHIHRDELRKLMARVSIVPLPPPPTTEGTPTKPVRLLEGPPRDIGQGLDRFGEHMDRPSSGTPGKGENNG